MKTIIKRPFEPVGRVRDIPNTLESLQKAVEGNIEIIRLPKGVTCIINETGKLKGLAPNFAICDREGWMIDHVVGTAVLVGTDGEDFCDCPITLEEWEDMLVELGN